MLAYSTIYISIYVCILESKNRKVGHFLFFVLFILFYVFRLFLSACIYVFENSLHLNVWDCSQSATTLWGRKQTKKMKQMVYDIHIYMFLLFRRTSFVLSLFFGLMQTPGKSVFLRVALRHLSGKKKTIHGCTGRYAILQL